MFGLELVVEIPQRCKVFALHASCAAFLSFVSAILSSIDTPIAHRQSYHLNDSSITLAILSPSRQSYHS